MKKILLILFATCYLYILSCEKNESPEIPATDSVSNNAMLKYRGSFMNGPYGMVNGIAKVVSSEGKLQLVLDSFMTSNGPDLKVYLSKEVMPISFIKLGDLKSTSGKQVYEIEGSPDFSQYRYALIHCEQYNHLFGSAELR